MSDALHYTDALTHKAGARYWIPTLDEQLKAVYYDPNRYGAGRGGWWQWANCSDSPGISGLPGVGQTSVGVDPFVADTIPLGAYPSSKSPWGLLDTSGGAPEWNEGAFPPGSPRERGLLFSQAGAGYGGDSIEGMNTADPLFSGGLRIASDIPSPGTILILTLPLVPPRRSARVHTR